jgi:hypothetical protein
MSVNALQYIGRHHSLQQFEKEIERFHSHLIEEGYSINSARNMTLGHP